VVKVGPTAYLSEEPTTSPALGELWVDRDIKTLSIGTDASTWQKVAAPFLGGTGGLVVFVAPEFPNSTDSLANDGQTVPFLTINRAVIEVTKNVISDALAGLSTGTNRYLIVLATGRHCVINGPGTSSDTFDVVYNSPYTTITQAQLQQFNQIDGGLILPRGVSIIGMDLKKCEVRPTYVPAYTHPAFPINYSQQSGGPVFANQPLSSVFRWSGNTYVSNFSGLDKVEDCTVIGISASATGIAVFKTDRPHGLNYNDFVQVTYTNSADQAGASFSSDAYYVNPLNSYQFEISAGSWTQTTVTPVLASSLPSLYLLPTAQGTVKFDVANIYPYYVPQDGVSYEKSGYSHNRLSLLKNASINDLNQYYIKVQTAFPAYFGNTVNRNVVSVPEVEIVAPTEFEYPDNISSNSTDNTSPYANQVNLRSNYGMASGDFDGNLVTGFKSVILNACTAVSIQKDPAAYELYTSAAQNWVPLSSVVQAKLPTGTSITSIPTLLQLEELNVTAIPNLRYYYSTILTDSLKSTGLADPNNDFRHFGFRLSGANSFLQAQSIYTIGAAIGVWAREGGLISLTGATTNFGSVALQAEGFAGIGTIGGSNQINRGFLQTGVVRPLELLESDVIADSQKRILYLGSRVTRISLDPTNPAVQLVYLESEFDPTSILPFSLKPGSAVYISDAVCTYRGFFVTDGSFTCIRSETDPILNPCSAGGAILRLRYSDSSIPNGPGADFNVPYIRRFEDPRLPTEKSYAFYVQSTNPVSQAPQLGSVVRLNQTGQSLSTTIKRNYQFDPGKFGGISQVFTVDAVETAQLSSSSNFNYKLNDASQSTNYVVYASLSDASTPWTQSTTNPGGTLVPFNTPQGSYTTYNHRNYYAAENNLWSALYYSTNFTPNNGPTKVSPDKRDSPFVTSSVLARQEAITDAYQGYVPDPFYDYYTKQIPAAYNADFTYMRGAVVPYTAFDPQFQIDMDDGSPNFGIIFDRIPDPSFSTISVGPSTIVQTAVAMTTPYVATPSFGRPEIIRLELLSVQKIINPKQGLSILRLSTIGVNTVEYIRVISLSSNVITAIRNYYPTYSQATAPTTWPSGTIVTPCISSGYPEPSVYDPDWAVTKASMFRFFQLMGYSNTQMSSWLVPRYSGERLFLNTNLPYSPINGYANITASWPIEFNNPSSIIASNHTWQYAGYFDYSRGLPKYQVNEISKKLSFDYLSSTSWGGRLSITGANETGDVVFLGPIKEALTAQYYEANNPLDYAANRMLYSAPPVIDFPNSVLVYSVDDISSEFTYTGVPNTTGQTVFNLTRGGYAIPESQLSTNGLFVFLGGVVQAPGEAYSIQQSGPGGPVAAQIVFTEPPEKGTSCDIRIVTSDDESETVEVVRFVPSPTFDGGVSSFILTPGIATLTNLNSFVFLGGVEQNPAGTTQTSAAYTITSSIGASTLNFIGAAPLPGTTCDIRGILSGTRFRNNNVSSVFVSSTDDIAPLFNNTRSTFPLKIDGIDVDPTKVTSQNMFVSLGGVMQMPIASSGDPLAGIAYTVALSGVSSTLEITFAQPPSIGTTCNIRIITSDEFLTCPLPAGLLDNTLRDGPGVEVNDLGQIIAIDPGLIG
jgi:hypothetical protein